MKRKTSTLLDFLGAPFSCCASVAVSARAVPVMEMEKKTDYSNESNTHVTVYIMRYNFCKGSRSWHL